MPSSPRRAISHRSFLTGLQVQPLHKSAPGSPTASGVADPTGANDLISVSLAAAFPDLGLWLTGPAAVQRALCEAMHPGLKRAAVPVPEETARVGDVNAASVRRQGQPDAGTAIPAFIPVFILSHDNPTHVHAMVRFLRCYNISNITVYDTASSLPLHLDLLRALERVATVRHLPENAGPRSFLSPANLATLPRHFALTDPDLRPHPDLPPNFLAYLAFLTRAFPGRKAGFALDLALRDQFVPGVHDPGSGATIAEWEEQHFWGTRLPVPAGGPPDPLFDASIDTTFAVYDRETHVTGSGDGVRVGGTFMATHVPWLCFAAASYVSKVEWAHFQARPNAWSSTGRLARMNSIEHGEVCKQR
jgi:hypothetical protein